MKFTFNKNIIISIFCFVVVAVNIYNQIMSHPDHLIDTSQLIRDCIPLIVSLVQTTSGLMAHHTNPDGTGVKTAYDPKRDDKEN